MRKDPFGRNMARRAAWFLRRPVMMILITGIAIRLLISPMLTLGYDAYHWGLAMQNIHSGNGLYGLDGYYYPPVWGYIMGFASGIGDLLFGIPILGERFTEALQTELGGHALSSATITTVSFNIFMKLIIFVADILAGYMIYGFLKEHTKDEKKATYGFALWFLCPSVIVISSVCTTFDAFSVLFLIFAAVMAFRSRYIVAGSMLCLSVLTKFFPAFFVPFFISYVLAKHRGDGTVRKRFAELSAGIAITAIAVFMPQILDGTVLDSFSFIANRTSGGMGLGLGALETYGTVAIYAAISAAAVLIAFRYYKEGDASEGAAVKCMLLTAAATLLYPPTAQYTLIVMPFLIMYIVMTDRVLMRSWVLLSVFVTIFALMNNVSLLLSLGAYTDLISLETVVALTEGYRGAMVFSARIETIVYFASGIMQYVSILSVPYLLLFGRRPNGTRGYADRASA